jgi:hypothetical protein
VVFHLLAMAAKALRPWKRRREKYRTRDDEDSASGEESDGSYAYDSDEDDGLSDIELPHDDCYVAPQGPERFFGVPAIATKIEDLD